MIERMDDVPDGADQRGLAGAVRTEQAEEAAGGHLEVEGVEGERAVVVALGELPQLEGGGHPSMIASQTPGLDWAISNIATS
jgi:hypothetical protein